MRASVDLAEAVVAAHRQIEPWVRRTRLERSAIYSDMTGANVFFKYENLQHTGSFKLRGATNWLLSLPPEQQVRQIVTASTGNHGKAVAYAAGQLSSTAVVFAPKNSDAAKLNSIRALGAEIRFAGTDCVEAEKAAREFAAGRNAAYVSPYNDWSVIAGQGVVGLEICEQLDQVDGVIASLGGGGLVSGIAGFVKTQFPDCKIVGCSPENSSVMIDSLAAGELLDLPSTDTLSDGTAGGVENDSITFELCRQLIDKTVSVSEDDIRDSLCDFVETHGMLIEGAAAVSIAGLLKTRNMFSAKNVVVVLCGANIALDKLAGAIQQRQVRLH